jgi:hypothetical protein
MSWSTRIISIVWKVAMKNTDVLFRRLKSLECRDDDRIILRWLIPSGTPVSHVKFTWIDDTAKLGTVMNEAQF